jgi:phospho-N-acetylmuramoyl-pentapeptide-transferase
MVVSILGTKALINWLTRHNVGQPIREDGPEGHHTKAGTPTMGGLAIVGSAVIGYTVAHVRGGVVFTRAGIVVILTILGAGLVGLLDDWIKVSRERNLGLSKRAKIAGLLTVSTAFPIAMLTWTDIHTQLSFTRFDSPGIELGPVGWSILAVLMIVGTTNGVNLTDGADGLAAGASVYTFIAFVVIGFWAFRHPETYDIPAALDLAVVSASMLGGCAGFLWWNAAPAQIFMGDTGALAIGAGLATLALATSTQLLLLILGGLFVVETLSVMLQVGSFRLFGGRRVFRMAPIHHHFELGGWPETTVIIRFWIVAGLTTALGLGIFYADFIATGGID